ncbi:MAG: hypothetical protein G3I09_01825 [Ferrovum sp.]|nr:hypothetical protein [Ferrovum sp.]
MLVLLVWSVAAFLLLRRGPYGVEEEAAKALLLDWSMADHVANSVVTLGVPDFRVLLWFPLGFLWPGQVMAAKGVMVALMAATAWGLYRWSEEEGKEEAALLATGLLLILPVTLWQIDHLSVGIGVLASFMGGFWLDRSYRQSPRVLGGSYFAQLGLAWFAVSLDPAGLAYPLLLAWSWYKNPVTPIQQRLFFIGLGIFTLIALLLRWGWGGGGWFHNPLQELPMLWGHFHEFDSELSLMDWLGGLGLMLLLATVVLHQRRILFQSLLGQCLWVGLLISLFKGQGTFIFLAVTVLLYAGLPWMLQLGHSKLGFMAQRGWVLAAVFVVSSVSMHADRGWFELGRELQLTAQDELIRTMAVTVEQVRHEAEIQHLPDPRIRVASQWPARTMLACRCDALPLPPAAKDGPAQLAMMKGLTHLIMVPTTPANLGLTQNLSVLGNEVETVSLQPGGVMLQIRKPDLAPAAVAPTLDEPAPPAPGDPVK